MEKIPLFAGPKVIITHTDNDGVISLAAFFKALESKFGFSEYKTLHTFFSSTRYLITTLAESIMVLTLKKIELQNLYVFDLPLSEKAYYLSLAYNNVVWVDHHHWDFIPNIGRFYSFHFPNAKSAAEIIVRGTGIDFDLFKLASDKLNDEFFSSKGKMLKDLIFLFHTKPNFRTELYRLARKMATMGINVLKDETYKKMLRNFYEYINRVKGIIINNVKTYDIDKYRIAIIPGGPELPVYWIKELLKEHIMSPFDVIIVIRNHGYFQHIEFRTHTDFNVLSIGKELGASGNEYACGITLKGNKMYIDDLLKLIKKVILSKKYSNLCKDV